MTIRVIDLETTGTDPAVDAIVEIASVDVYRGVHRGADGHGITSVREDLVFPGQAIPPESSAVHHLIDADVAASPRIEKIIDGYKTADCYVAHNAAFERSFLDRYFGEVPWVCTYKCALRVWPEAPAHNNQTLRYWLGIIEPFGTPRDKIAPHRALSDVIVTAAVFVELLKRAKWSDLLQWSKEPALHTMIRFGKKHPNKSYAEVAREDPSYLTWLIDKSDMDEGVKFSARYWLDKAKAEAAP